MVARSEGSWSVVRRQGDPETIEEVVHTDEVEERWANLVRKLNRLRRVQRYFHNLGEYLKRYPSGLRHSLSKHFPKQ